MSAKSKIDWTDSTWNPVTGCTKISAGCVNCYAKPQAERIQRMQPTGRYRNGFNVTCHEDALNIPIRWKKGRRIFVNSMSNLFHEDVPFEFIDKVYAVMALCPQHTFQIVTKRTERALEYYNRLTGEMRHAYMESAWNSIDLDHPKVTVWPLPNVHFYVTAENQEMANQRIPILLQIPAAVRGVSIEPMIGPIDLIHLPCDECGAGIRDGGGVRIIEDPAHPLHPDNTGDGPGCDWCPVCTDAGEPRIHGIDHVILGGESGPNARPMHPDWVRSVRDQCIEANVPFFFKQWGEWAIADLANVEYAKEYRFIELDGKNSTHWTIDRHSKNTAHMMRVGKRRAGHRLDGVEWRQEP